MSKIISAKIGKFYYEKFTKPIRSKKDLVLMLLDTIDALYLGENMIEDAQGTIIVKVSRMSRVFYELGDKMFSIVFPFSLDKNSDPKYCIFDSVTERIVDARTVSFMRTIIKDIDLVSSTFEQLLEQVYFNADSEKFDYEFIDGCCKIILRLFTTESGYIRYDYDVEHQNGIRHPLNHLDINYSSKCTYKLGLYNRIVMSQFIELLDIETDCKFVN